MAQHSAQERYRQEGNGSDETVLSPDPILFARAARVLSRLFGHPDCLEEREVAEATEVSLGLYPEGFRRYGSDPEAFRTHWEEEKDLFTGNPPALQLEESVHKQWTGDESHPLHGARGSAWGDPAMHMQEVLARFGVVLDPHELRAPDHLAVILEFLGFLLENRPLAEVRSFCEDHLDWPAELSEQAKELGTNGVTVLLVEAADRLVKNIITYEHIEGKER